MAAFRFACHLIQYEGEDRTDPDKVFREVSDAGWDVVEGQVVQDADELVELATKAREYRLHVVNVLGAQNSGIDTAKFNVTLGNVAAEVPQLPRPDLRSDPSDADFQQAASALESVLAFAERHGIRAFHHAHLRSMIETIQDAERLLNAAPGLWLLLDTGHLLAAGSDPLEAFESPVLRNRIGHVHLKDFHADSPQTWDHRTMRFWQDARFAELGAGNVGFDARAILRKLEEIEYDGWVSVELDRPYFTQTPAEAAVVNREYLRRLGY